MAVFGKIAFSIALLLLTWVIAFAHFRAASRASSFLDAARLRPPIQMTSLRFIVGFLLLLVGTWALTVGLHRFVPLFLGSDAFQWIDRAAAAVRLELPGPSGELPSAPRETPVAPVVIAVTLLLSLQEEITFRSYLPYVALRGLPLILSVPIASVAFGLFHCSGAGFISHAIFGCLMALIVHLSRSIWPAVLIHAVYNLSYYRINLLDRTSIGKWPSSQPLSTSVVIFVLGAVMFILGCWMIRYIRRRTALSRSGTGETSSNGTPPDPPKGPRRRPRIRLAFCVAILVFVGFLLYRGHAYVRKYQGIKAQGSTESREQFVSKFSTVDETWTEGAIIAHAGPPSQLTESGGSRLLIYRWKRIDWVSWDLSVISGVSAHRSFTFIDGHMVSWTSSDGGSFLRLSGVKPEP